MAQQFDIKTLVLKRWDASQTKALFGSDNHCRGKYISFQSHHFIDVIPSSPDSGLLGSYASLRSPQFSRRQSLSDIHIVQNMTLIGDSGTFWNNDAAVMYITLVQLSDSSRWEYDTIYASIQDYFDAAASSPTSGTDAGASSPTSGSAAAAQWALYYSLDYCDFVLFTKNISLNTLNDLLWKMTLIDDAKFNAIRDTFTIYCFGKEFLQDAFHQIRDCPEPLTLAWNDTLSLSMNFSVRDFPAEKYFTQVIKKVENNAVKFHVHRLHGRYDLNYTTEQITGTQALKIIYHINQVIESHQIQQKCSSQFCANQPQKQLPICSEYEISFLSPSAQDRGSPRNTSFCSDFDDYATKMIEKLYCLISAQEQKEAASYIEYVKETLRSLHELARNDFSEEFVLCVLPSLITFLRIITQKQSFLSSESNTSAKNKIHESCAKLQKSYFTAMNTLSLCTMHSERQFIHTPAFNANYFDVPPKLLAYYSAIVCDIASQLKGEDQQHPLYHYIIIPDYRADIHVEPLNITYKKDTVDHLAIINLSEKYFYQPQKAIMLLAHEVGHYEGDRKRDIRADNIFYMIGITVLYHTPLRHYVAKDTPYFTKDSLIGLLAQVFGDYLNEQYHIYHPQKNRGIDYILSDITEFLVEYRYGIGFLESSTHRSDLINRWVHAMAEARYSDSQNAEIVSVLSSLSETENVDYFTNLSQYPNCLGSYEAIARSLASHCEAMVLLNNDENPVLSIMEFCQEVIELFSECYADWQMHSILGSYFDMGAYWTMLVETERQGNSTQEEKDTTLPEINHKHRFIVMKRMCGNDDPSEEFLNRLEETVVQSVIEYLKRCTTSRCGSMESILKAVYCNPINWKQWCNSLCKVLSDYESQIQSMYDNSSSNILTDPIL